MKRKRSDIYNLLHHEEIKTSGTKTTNKEHNETCEQNVEKC